MNTKHIIILGPPGSGKGTQAERIHEQFGLFLFSTGDFMREEAKSGSIIGKTFQKVWDRGQGELMTDKLVNDFVNSKLEKIDLSKGVIFDGYPRTILQAENLDRKLMVSKENLIVLNIVVNKNFLIDRMSTRKICVKCKKVFFRPEENNIRKCDKCQGELIRRQEDDPEVVEKRINVYERQTKPLIDYYNEKSTFININGEPPIEEVTQDIIEKLSKII